MARQISGLWELTPAEQLLINQALPAYERELWAKHRTYPPVEFLRLQAIFAETLGFEPGSRHGPKAVRKPCDVDVESRPTMDTVQTVAKELGLTDQRVSQLCRERILASAKAGKSWRILRSGWQEYAKQRERSR